MKPAWEQIALPILRYIANHEGQMLTTFDMAEVLHIETDTIKNEVRRLDQDGWLLMGPMSELCSGNAWLPDPILSPKAARLLGIWPEETL